MFRMLTVEGLTITCGRSVRSDVAALYDTLRNIPYIRMATPQRGPWQLLENTEGR